MSDLNKKYKCIYVGFFIWMFLQIFWGILWMFNNISAIPEFGDTIEYLNLSNTFTLDEYRPILYPLLLNLIQKLSLICKLQYQNILYVLQFTCGILSTMYLCNALIKASSNFKYKLSLTVAGRRCLLLMVAFYINTIPMIMFMNFTVLTDSLALSFLEFMLGSVISLYFVGEKNILDICIIGITYGIQALLRADRFYSVLVFLLAFIIVYFVKNRKNKTNVSVVAMFLCVVLSVAGAVKITNHFTQVKGINGRIETNASFVLLDRIVWPHMEECYEEFPEQIKQLISIEDAKKFDEHNNNVMYQMAPLIEGQVGKQEADAIYGEMAKVVFKEKGIVVVADITKDILAFLFPPVANVFSLLGGMSTATEWNVHCMSTVTPILTKVVHYYYTVSFGAVVLPMLIIFCALSKSFRKTLKPLVPIFFVGALLAFWFSIGDGAPPNDRYALVLYLLYGLIVCLTLLNSARRVFDNSMKNRKGKYASHTEER